MDKEAWILKGELIVLKAWRTGNSIMLLLDNGEIYKSKARRVKRDGKHKRNASSNGD